MRKILIGIILTIAVSIGVTGAFVIFTEGNEGYIGLTEGEAISKARFERTPLRFAERDGEKQQLTDDFVSNRVNLTIENGKVTAVDFY